MADLKAFADLVNETVYTSHGLALSLKYRPNAITSALMRRVKRTQDEGEAGESIAVQTIAVVAEWDLTDKGKPVELTAEGLEKVPWMLQLAILKHCTEDASPNPARPASS